MKKNRNYNFIFLIVWGVLFGGIPLGIMFSGEMGSERWFLLIFVIIGLVAIIFGIKNFVYMLKDKNLIKTGTDGVGHYISKQGYGSINNVAMFKIIFDFTNEQNQTIQVTTSELYTFEEVEQLASMEQFAIKYKGENAVIVPSTVVKKKRKDACEYCGTKMEGDKCQNCGAIKKY